MKPIVPLLDWQQTYVDDDSRFKLVVAAAQSGKSMGTTLEIVMEVIAKAGLWIMLSASERQSVELMEKVKMHTRAMGAAIDVEDGFFGTTEIAQHTARFPNGGRIIALPANPDTARGYSGNAFLDEFALHRDPLAIWAAMMTRATHGYKVRVASTLKGKNNKFYELCKDLGLHDGVRPSQQPVKRNGWSGHWVDIHMVREQRAKLGIVLDVEGLRAAIADDVIWMQDYENIPMADGETFLPLALVLACESREASIEWDGQPRPGLSAGWDFARTKDGSVIFIGYPAGPLAVVCGVKWISGLTYAQQRSFARGVAEVVQASSGRFAMDSTGNGAQLAEELSGEYSCMEPVQFATRVETGARDEKNKPITMPVKESMAYALKRRMEDGEVLIPESRQIRRACEAVKRMVGVTGNVRLDAANTKDGHADEFWALALMVGAMTEARSYVPASAGGLMGSPVMGGLLGKVF